MFNRYKAKKVFHIVLFFAIASTIGITIGYGITYWQKSKNKTNAEIALGDDDKIIEEKKVTPDGIVWYLLQRGDETAVRVNDKIIIPFAKNQNVFYSSFDKRLHVKEKKYLSNRSSYQQFYSIYDFNGNAIVSKREGYSTIEIVKIKEGDRFYYSTILKFDGEYHYGACDKTGTCIIEPVSDTPISYEESDDGYAECAVDMFVAEINRKKYYTYKYMDENLRVKSYCTPNKIYYAHEIEGNLYNEDEMPQIAISKKLFFFNNELYTYDHEDESGYIYENVNSDVAFSLNEDGSRFFYYCPAGIFNFEKYDISSRKNVIRIVKERKTRYNLIKNKTNSKIDDFVVELNNGKVPNEEKVATRQPVTSDYSPQSSSDGGRSVKSPTYDNAPKQPRRDICQACRNTGECRACNGTGQTISEMSIVSEKTVNRKCRVCGGSGRCHACKGDGWLDQGKDF